MFGTEKLKLIGIKDDLKLPRDDIGIICDNVPEYLYIAGMLMRE